MWIHSGVACDPDRTIQADEWPNLGARLNNHRPVPHHHVLCDRCACGHKEPRLFLTVATRIESDSQPTCDGLLVCCHHLMRLRYHIDCTIQRIQTERFYFSDGIVDASSQQCINEHSVRTAIRTTAQTPAISRRSIRSTMEQRHRHCPVASHHTPATGFHNASHGHDIMTTRHHPSIDDEYGVAVPQTLPEFCWNDLHIGMRRVEGVSAPEGHAPASK